MAQSDVQKLIQSLAGVQTGAQANSQNSANSGNPNTVYNTAAWGYGGPPVSNAQGGMTTNNFSDAADTTLGSWQPPAGWGSVGNNTGAVLPLGTMPINTGWTTTPPATTPPPTTTPPPVTTPPPPTTRPIVTNPVNGGDSLTWSGGTTGNFGNTGVFTSRGPGVANEFSDGNTFNLDNVSSGLNNVINTIQQNLGIGEGGFNLGQFIDAITEPAFPGNFYNGELGSVNKANVVAGILNRVIPGVGTLASWLASKIPQTATGLLGNIRDFFARGRIQEAVDLIYRQAAIDKANGQDPYTNPYTGQNELSDRTPFINWATINGWANKPQITGTPTVDLGELEQVPPPSPPPTVGGGAGAEGGGGGASSGGGWGGGGFGGGGGGGRTGTVDIGAIQQVTQKK